MKSIPLSQGRTRTITLGVVLACATPLVTAPPAVASDVLVADISEDVVSVIDTETNQITGDPIAVGDSPSAVAISPDGSRAYVANFGDDTVSVIDIEARAVQTTISVGLGPQSVAFSPDGTRAYTANGNGNSVSVIDTQTSSVIGGPITVGSFPQSVAITPDGSRAFTANRVASIFNPPPGTLTVIDTATNDVVGDPIPVGSGPFEIEFTPDGSSGYVPNQGDGTVSVIDLATNTPAGSPIPVGGGPESIAITPDGRRVYVANFLFGDTLTVINTETNAVVGDPITVGNQPRGLAVTPDGERIYVANLTDGTVSVVDTETNSAIGDPIPVTPQPFAVAITPDQGPVAAFRANAAAAGSRTAFDGSTSRDPDPGGTIARYDWDFGDGSTAQNAGPRPRHVYEAPGRYSVILRVTDAAGCSTTVISTGQTAYCNGGPAASRTREITIPASSRGPGLSLGGAKRQTLDRKIRLRVTCEVACRAVATGRLVTTRPKARDRDERRRRFKLGGDTVRIAAGRRTKLELTLPKRTHRAAQRTMEKPRGKVVAKLRVRASDEAGGSRTRTRTVKLRSKR